MPIQCTFSTDTYSDGRVFYSCKIENQTIPASKSLNLQGKHKRGKSLKDVKEVIFNGCKLSKIPQELTSFFPSLEDLSVWSSNLSTISKKDLAEYRLLKRIFICNSDIEFLPGDLFDGFYNLEEISFAGNQIKIIEPNILDGHKEIKHVNLANNPNYDLLFSIYPTFKSNASLNDMKRIIKDVFLKNFKEFKNLMRADFAKEIFTFNADPELRSSFYTDLFNLSRSDESKDFTIQIGNHKFLVHKFILVARSPTLAEVIHINPLVKKMKLVDISVNIFTIILNYLYTDQFPMNEDTISYLNIFASSGLLKIEELKNLAANQLLDKVNRQNCVEILKLSNKYEHLELKEKAFYIVKRSFPKLMFKDNWIGDPTLVADMIDKFLKKEEAIKRIEHEFELERMES